MFRFSLITLLLIGLTNRCLSFSMRYSSHRLSFVPFASRIRPTTVLFESDSSDPSEQILCDLQTFLRLTELVSTGGAAKFVIQAGEVSLNQVVETRRAKKLFDGDTVQFSGKTLNVAESVRAKGYVYKKKVKKEKPQAKVIDADGTLEFGGRFRSEEWRKERKERKAERKNKKVGE